MNLTDRVEQAIVSFLEKGDAFTLLDISNSVKNDGNGFVRHRDCREEAISILHRLEDDEDENIADYMCTSIMVTTPRGQEYASLYHREDFDPDDYVNKCQVALKPSQIQTQTIKPVTPVPSTNPTNPSPIFNTSTFKTNAHVYKLLKPMRKDGSIEIPKSLLVESGLLNKVIDIVNHPNSISLVPGQSRIAISGMRISKTSLAKSNLESDDIIEAASFTDKIVLA